MVTATEPPATMAVPLMAVMVWPLFSKLSLLLTLILTGVSSLVVAVSLAISATGLTVMAMLSVSESVPSEVTTVTVSEPL